MNAPQQEITFKSTHYQTDDRTPCYTKLELDTVGPILVLSIMVESIILEGYAKGYKDRLVLADLSFVFPNLRKACLALVSWPDKHQSLFSLKSIGLFLPFFKAIFALPSIDSFPGNYRLSWHKTIILFFGFLFFTEYKLNFTS